MASFGVAATCMDGRIQAAVRKYLKDKYNVDWVDIVAQPGMNKFLADAKNMRIPLAILLICCFIPFLFLFIVKRIQHHVVLWNIRRMLGISILHHNAGILALVGHAQCAGNQACKEEQIQHLIRAKEAVECFGFEVEIVLLWVEDDWKTVQVIDENSASIRSTHQYMVRTAK